MSQATNLASGVPQSSPFSVSDVAALLRALVTLHSGASRPVVVDAEGQGSWLKVVSATRWELYYHDGTNDVLLGTLDPTNHIWTMNGRVILQSASAPASASDAGTSGEVRWNSSYIYVCVATNTWKRAALSTW